MAQPMQESTKQPTPTRSPTLNVGDVGADGGDDAGDLVARHHRIDRILPHSLRTVMDVGVADASST